MILTETDLTILRATDEILRQAERAAIELVIGGVSEIPAMDAASLGRLAGAFDAAREALADALVVYEVRGSKWDGRTSPVTAA